MYEYPSTESRTNGLRQRGKLSSNSEECANAIVQSAAGSVLEYVSRCVKNIAYHKGPANAVDLNSLLSSPRDNFELNSTPSTTASQTQQWLPPQTPSQGFVPQPDFQDFSLFAAPSPTQVTQPRTTSLGSNQRPTFKTNYPRAYSAPQQLGSIRRPSRNNLPPVPLFHANPQGSSISLDQTVIDFAAEMPGGKLQSKCKQLRRVLTWPTEINVAYDGTSADLGSDDIQNLSWEDLCSSTESLLPVGNFTAINDSAMGTISPKDLLMDNSGSVPPSAAFTNLTTPSSVYLGTPDDSFEVSPMFDSLDAPETWPSLFDHEEPAAINGAEMTRTTSGSSQIVVHPGGMSRKRSSTTASPMTPNLKMSSVAGISKRESKVLAPIVVDMNDAVAVKRARNTAAARKSRDKKFKESAADKLRIAELEEQVELWKTRALAAGFTG
ncbi:hypothetical protein K461DRAFT_267738 [Myriangium duriaei CBS 260.36]|uniref:BZIP domain-containing protein n=1 Tax=Myriangium duriaei CBS 260.36 TaxID=1168546 RepID=A0A9P4J080_9PEZI|nr:hypothetical protein K461DRAFT_267738 [Myriangium duriaei CBS 260.36]